jgi:hypothetical protein
MIEGIKDLLDVRFHHPGLSSELERDGPGIHRSQGSNLWPIAIATAPDVLLVDGVQEARYCQLQELVFYGGNAQGTLRALPLGNRVSSDECGAVPLLLQALPEVVDVRVQVLLLGLGTHLVPSGGGILPDVAPALLQELLVEHSVEVAESIARLTCRLLCSSLQGGWPWGSDPSRSGHVSYAGSVFLSAPSPCERLSRL